MKKFNNIMLYVQILMLLILLIILISSAWKPNLLNITEILCGITLLVIGYNNHTTFKRKNMTFVYTLFGILIIILGVANTLNG